MAIERLNKTFVDGEVWDSTDINPISSKIDECVDQINLNTNEIETARDGETDLNTRINRDLETNSTYRDEAYKWANEAEDTQVTDSAGHSGYSAYHYSKKAENSANNAAQSETSAANSASAAATSEANAATSESNAAASEQKAMQWAENDYGTEVESGKYSAKHWATEAQIIVQKKVTKVENIVELLQVDTSKLENGEGFYVLGYHTRNDGGGGIFYWDADEDKANHNGGTIIDPTQTFPSDWSDTTQQETWFTASGTGNGCWKRVIGDYVTPEMFGAMGDGVTDDINSISKALEFAYTIPVQLSSKTYAVGDSIIINSEQKLYGNGRHVTTIKLKDNANTDVIKTYNFDSLTGSNTWLVSNGNIYGFEIKNLSVDGNSANNTTGYGMKIYAKGYRIENVLIKDVAEVGFYSENAAVGGQEDYKDMPESYIDLDIRNTGSHGFQFRGPHDTHIVRLIVGIAGGKGALIEGDGSTRSGSCDIDFAHVYATSDIAFDIGCPIRASMITAETSDKECVVIRNVDCQINMLKAYNTDRQGLGYYAVVIESSRNQISNLYIRPDANKTPYGNGLKITGAWNKIGTLLILNENNTYSGTGLYIADTAKYTKILGGRIYHYSESGGVGFHFDGTSFCDINLELQDCNTFFKYSNSGGANTFKIRGWSDGSYTLFDPEVILNETDTFDLVLEDGGIKKWSQRYFQKTNCLVDTTGVYTVSVSHNLIHTPSIKKTHVTVAEETDVTDFVLDYVKVKSVTDTNITIEYKVSTASATNGAAITLNVYAAI